MFLFCLDVIPDTIILPIQVVGVANTGTIIRFTTEKTGKKKFIFNIGECVPDAYLLGPFMLHCHIFWHKFAGLATVQLVDPKDTRKNVEVNQEWTAACPT